MSASMRLFFAVELSPEAHAAIAEVQTRLRTAFGDTGIRWVPPAQFHYTLKFLGDTPETDLEAVKTAGKTVAARTQPFTFTLAGLGVFPQQRRPQVLWIGATKGVPHLNALAESLDGELTQYGFPVETRRFNAHLTLARMKSPEGEEAVAKGFAAEAAALVLASRATHHGGEERAQPKADALGVLAVNSFVLMESELHPSGPVYTVRETFMLTTL